MDDLPIPGGPQMNTGRTGATFSSNSDSSFGVMVFEAFMSLEVYVLSWESWLQSERTTTSKGLSTGKSESS
jgi:hypothetical protein